MSLESIFAIHFNWLVVTRTILVTWVEDDLVIGVLLTIFFERRGHRRIPRRTSAQQCRQRRQRRCHVAVRRRERPTLTDFQAATTASRHVVIAAARSTR